jgi:hypothetical protein
VFETVPESDAVEWTLVRAFVETVKDFKPTLPCGSGIQLCAHGLPAALAGSFEKRSFSATDIEKPASASGACHLGDEGNAATVAEAGCNAVPCPVVFGVVRLQLFWRWIGDADSTGGALEDVELQAGDRV